MNSGFFCEIFLSDDLYRLCKLVSIFSNSSHLEWRAELLDTILKGTHLGTIPARLGLIWFSSFRGEDLNVKVYDGRRIPGFSVKFFFQTIYTDYAN
jgi:hypothetical protein